MLNIKDTIFYIKLHSCSSENAVSQKLVKNQYSATVLPMFAGETESSWQTWLSKHLAKQDLSRMTAYIDAM